MRLVSRGPHTVMNTIVLFLRPSNASSLSGAFAGVGLPRHGPEQRVCLVHGRLTSLCLYSERYVPHSRISVSVMGSAEKDNDRCVHFDWCTAPSLLTGHFGAFQYLEMPQECSQTFYLHLAELLPWQTCSGGLESGSGEVVETPFGAYMFATRSHTGPQYELPLVPILAFFELFVRDLLLRKLDPIRAVWPTSSRQPFRQLPAWGMSVGGQGDG